MGIGQERKDESDPMPPAHGRLKILIVDDSKTSRLALERILAPLGDCDLAGDGVDALKAFSLAWERGDPYHLICLDIMMPHLDGLQALKMIRTMEREMGILKADGAKIIMITSIENPLYVFEAYHRGGANAYLYKPIDMHKILAELKRLELIP